MSLQTRLGDFITAVGTDVKLLRTYITGSSTGDLNGLTTTDKTSLVAALNEVQAGSSGAPPDASTTAKGVVELATGAETVTGTDSVRAVTPAGLTSKIDTDNTLAGNDDTKLASQKAVKTYIDNQISGVTIADASTSVKGKVQLATGAETITGTDSAKAVTAAGLTSKLDTDTSLTGNADTRIATQKAVKAYVDTSITNAAVPDATSSVKGKVELATDAEALAGTDTVRAVTPANVAAVFTDRIDTNTALGSSNTKISSQLAVKTYVDGIIAAANAMVYKGVIDASTNPNYPAANAGDTYVISVAGKIGGASGLDVEVGDMAICTNDGTSAGNQATVGSSWNIIQKNIVGAVTGPASSNTGTLVSFSGTSGKVVQDTAVGISTDGTMAANTDNLLSTQKAVRTYLAATYYTQTQLGNYDTDLAAAYATAKA